MPKRAQVALVDFRVVADGFDRRTAHSSSRPSIAPSPPVFAQEAVDLGVVGGESVDIGLGDAVLFSEKRGEDHPGDDVVPLVVAVARGRAERLLGDRRLEDYVVVGIGHDGPPACKLRLVARDRVAAALLVGVVHRVDLFKDDGFEGNVPGAQRVGQVELGGGAPRDADRRAGQVFEFDDAEVGVDHKSLTVVKGGGGKVRGPLGIAVERPGGVADQDVDLARLDGRLPLGRGERDKLDGVGVAQHRGRDRPAKVDVKSAPGPVRLDEAKARERVVYAADEPAAIQHPVERLPVGDRRDGQEPRPSGAE